MLNGTSNSAGGKRVKIIVTNSFVKTQNLSEIATIVQNEFPGKMPRDKLLESVVDADGLFCLPYDQIDKELLDAGRNLKVIATVSAGFSHIDIDECKRRGIRVGYAEGIPTESTAELAMGLLLATSRRIVEMAESGKIGELKHLASLSDIYGKGIADSIVGIYGLGRIGRSIAEKLSAFKPAKIIYNDVKPVLTDNNYTPVSFDDLLKKSDFLIVSANSTKDNYKVFDKRAFSRMKTDSIFINVARGSLVNTEDLLQAVKNGQIGGAGIDVVDPEPLPCDHPLYQLKNCVILPHMGATVRATRQQMESATESNLYNFFCNKPMPHELSI